MMSESGLRCLASVTNILRFDVDGVHLRAGYKL